MRRFLALVVVLAAGAAALAGTPSASPSTAASGTFTITTFNESFVKQADGNVFLSAHDFATYAGTFAGANVFDGTIEIYKDGSASFHGSSTFTGTVAGCGTGTVVLNVEGAVDPSGKITRPGEETLSGKGTLPAHANLDFAGSLPALTYTGNLDC